MKKNFNLAGPERKALVKKIEEYTGDKPQYLGTPTYSYQIGVFNLSRYGELSWEDYADETAKKIVEWLKIAGFTAEDDTEETQEPEETADEAFEESTPVTEDASEIIDKEPDPEAQAELNAPVNMISTEEDTTDDAPDKDEADNASDEQTDKESDIVNEEQVEEGDEGQTETGENQTEQLTQEDTAEPQAEETDADDNHLTISFPDDLTDEQFDTLTKVVESKVTLLKHAFKTDSVALEQKDGKINFPWFAASDGDHTNGYTIFLQKLICFAKGAKRVTAQDHPVENEKYAFRTWLLRLGLIGPEYKGARKVLLENLTGSSAFRDGKRKTATMNTEQEVSA